jgi:hypothetical protein
MSSNNGLEGFKEKYKQKKKEMHRIKPPETQPHERGYVIRGFNPICIRIADDKSRKHEEQVDHKIAVLYIGERCDGIGPVDMTEGNGQSCYASNRV